MNRKTKNELFNYIIVSGIAFIVDFSMLARLSALFGTHYLTATLIAFIFGVWVNYTLSIRWVFSHRNLEKQKTTEFSLFLLIGILTLGLSMLGMSVLVEWLNIHYLLAKCITTGLTLITNFAARRILLFRQPTASTNALASTLQ